MAYHAQKDPDLQATAKVFRKIVSTGCDTGRFSTASPSPSVGGRKPGQPIPCRYGASPVRPGHSTPREKHMNRHFQDPSEAVKRSHDGVTTQRSVSPTSTVWTGQSSKKRVVSNRTPVKSTIGYSRRDKHLTGIPCEKRFLEGLTSDKWNLSYQALRLEKEWTELDQCRNMKRNSEIVQHRIDNMYMMSGSGIRLKPKYDVNESELQQLKDLSRARQVLRDKSKRNQPSTKGRQTNMSGRQSSKSGKTDASHPQIRISGDSQKEGTNTENPSQADWASDPGSRPIQSPCTPPGNHGDTVTDEAGKIINQNEKDSKHVAEDVVRTEEGEENKENIEVNPKSDGKEGQDGGDTDEGQQGEGAPTNENVGDGKETGVEKETVQNGLTEEIVAANGTKNVEKDVGEENVDLNEDETVKAKNVTPNDATETQDRSEKENEIDH